MDQTVETVQTVDRLDHVMIDAVAGLMDVDGVQLGETRPFRQARLQPAGRKKESPDHEDPIAARALVRLRGRLLVPPDEAYRHMADRLRPLNLTPALRHGDVDGEVIALALPGTIAQTHPNVRLAVILFLATALSCLFVGAQMTDAASASGQMNFNLLDGVPFAASLLAILVSHEFGHYLTARRLGAPVSLPYFIPLPLPPFGTLGAVITMPAPPRDRRQLLSVGAAGPIAGLIVALPILWYGLSLSHVQPLPAGGYQMEGNSILYALMKLLQFGRFLPSGGYDVFIHPVAFAGWAGLLVTSLNLIPAGQLDGGHILYSLVGEKWSGRVLWVILIGLAAMSFLWLGWLLWVGLVFVASRVGQTPLNDLTDLTPQQRLLAVGMLIIFVMVFTPIPLAFIP